MSRAITLVMTHLDEVISSGYPEVRYSNARSAQWLKQQLNSKSGSSDEELLIFIVDNLLSYANEYVAY